MTALDLATEAGMESCIIALEQPTVGVNNGTGRSMVRSVIHPSINNKLFEMCVSSVSVSTSSSGNTRNRR